MPLDDEFVELAARVRNWGRWGDDDELGTLNLIDAAAVKRGAACVQTGKAFSLAIPLDDNGPQIGFIPGRVQPDPQGVPDQRGHHRRPRRHPLLRRPDGPRRSRRAPTGTRSRTRATAATSGTVIPPTRSPRPARPECGIGLVKSLVTRGVLLDIARAQGRRRGGGGHRRSPVPTSTPPASRPACTVEPGDVVLLRTGAMSLFLAGDREGYASTNAGPSHAERRLVPRPRRRRGGHRQPHVRVRRVRAGRAAARARAAPGRDGHDPGPELEPRGAGGRLRRRRPRTRSCSRPRRNRSPAAPAPRSSPSR